MKVFFDGGCRSGRMEAAVVAAGRTTLLADLGPGTSGDAEWLALIHALRIAIAAGWADVVLLGDSADVIAKARGVLRCRGAAMAHLAALHDVLAGGALPRIRQVKRAQNLAGIALAARHPR